MWVLEKVPTQEEYEVAQLMLTAEQFTVYCLAIMMLAFEQRESVLVAVDIEIGGMH